MAGTEDAGRVLQTWRSPGQLLLSLEEIIKKDQIPANFTLALQQSISPNHQYLSFGHAKRPLWFDLKKAGALLHYDHEAFKFTQNWTMEDVQHAARILQENTKIKLDRPTSNASTLSTLIRQRSEAEDAFRRIAHKNAEYFDSFKESQDREQHSDIPIPTTSIGAQNEVRIKDEVSAQIDYKSPTLAPIPVPRPRRRLPVPSIPSPVRPFKTAQCPPQPGQGRTPIVTLTTAQSSATEKLRDNTDQLLQFKPEWQNVMGQNPCKITLQDLLQIKRIIPPLKLACVPGYISKGLPFLTQKIKMGCSETLLRSELLDLFEEDVKKLLQVSRRSAPPQTTSHDEDDHLFNRGSVPSVDENQNDVQPDCPSPVEKLDVMTALLSSKHLLDPLVLADMVRLWGQFSMPIPLVTPSVDDNVPNTGQEYIIHGSLFHDIPIKLSTPGSDSVTNYILRSPYRLVTALRYGATVELDHGKSWFLNKLLTTKSRFHCNEGILSTSSPPSIKGTVELIWLTKDSCESEIWKEVEDLYGRLEKNCILLLANLHGNFVNYIETVNWLHSMGSSFFFFKQGPPTAKEIELLTYFTQNAKVGRVQARPQTGSKEVVSELINCFAQTKTHNFQKGTIPKTHSIAEFGSSVAEPIIRTIDREGCSKIKSALASVVECNAGKTNTDMPTVVGSKILQELFITIENILQLPIHERITALRNLDREIAYMSYTTLEQIRTKDTNKREEIQTILDSIPESEWDFDPSLTSLNEELKELKLVAELNNVGIEHIFRAIGGLYEINLLDPTALPPFYKALSQFPRQVAQLVLEGHVFELLDGDTGTFSTAWFNAVMHSICQIRPGLRVFVISILGVQSSGKSTLLNALFGCRFSVSMGRCTRGLFLRMLFLEPSLQQEMGLDAILIIDTEGLNAPELMTLPDAEKKDNMMATFAMAISNLTIINVKGENVRPIVDILQIVVITIAGLEDAQISPNILLVQHLPEANRAIMANATDHFCFAIEDAIKVQDKLTPIGITNTKVLNKLRSTIKKQDMFMVFHPYRSGPTLNASPSVEYHKDVVELYQKIFGILKTESKSGMDFHHWHSLIGATWNAVAAANFSLRFKNLKEIHEFIDRESRIAAVKEEVQKAYNFHKSEIKNKILSHFSTRPGQPMKLNIEQELSHVLEKCPGVLHPDYYSCEKCPVALFKLSEFKKDIAVKSFSPDVLRTLDNGIEFIRNFIFAQLQSFLKTQTELVNSWQNTDSMIVHVVESNPIDKDNYNQETEEGKKSIVDRFMDRIAINLTSDADTASTFEEIKRTMLIEIHNVYKDSPVATRDNLKFLESTHVLNASNFLREEKAFQSKSVFSTVRRFINQETTTKRLNGHQANILEKGLKKIPSTLLDNANANEFQIGMVENLRLLVVELLQDFSEEQGKIRPSFGCKVHIYALKEMLTRMEISFYERTRKEALFGRADSYRQKLVATLSIGSSVTAEAERLAGFFLKVLQQKSKKSGDRDRKRHLLELLWLSCCENVRLRFFAHLVTEVRKGRHQAALWFFEHPGQEITTWFGNLVDYSALDVAEISASDCWNRETAKVFDYVLECRSMADLQKFSTTYFEKVVSIQYKNPFDKMQLSPKNFQLLKETLLSTINIQSVKMFSAILYKPPSEYKSISNKLGCLESCAWCGALCWGHVNHDQNSDDTRNHYTCHQPQGLIGICDFASEGLALSSCDTISDTAEVLRPSAVTPECWKDVKQSQGWSYMPHSFDDVNTLMIWFFVKLNHELSTKHCCQPCDVETFLSSVDRLDSLEQRVDSIMKLINERIKDD